MRAQLGERLAERARSKGGLGFDEVMEAALYDPEAGFFSRGRGAGRRGDFITSPEVGPLFGAVVARALDAWWRELGEPDPFTVIEVGAGRGALAISVRAAAPACGHALEYLLVERSAALRQLQAEHLPIGNQEGPRFRFLSEVPEGPVRGVILANELLDNLPFRLLERTEGGWCEVLALPGEDGTLREGLGLVQPELDAWMERLAPGTAPGARVPLQEQAMSWLEGVLGRVVEGRLVVLDYMTGTPELAGQPQQAWLRTFRGHERGAHPLEALGEQDITSEVCLDQLAGVRKPTSCVSQKAWLEGLGIDQLVEEGRRLWTERAAAADLDAMRARSRVREAEALLDPAGLGAFTVAEWLVP